MLKFTFDIETYYVIIDAVRLLQTSVVTKVVTVILKVMIAEYE